MLELVDLEKMFGAGGPEHLSSYELSGIFRPPLTCDHFVRKLNELDAKHIKQLVFGADYYELQMKAIDSQSTNQVFVCLSV